MAENTKITFALPQILEQEFKERVIKEKYSMRGKSRWVSEAIVYLLQLENFPELVSLSAQLRGFSSTQTIAIDKELKKNIDSAIVTVREKFPALEGVQSSIVRTAIIQRLLRG